MREFTKYIMVLAALTFYTLTSYAGENRLNVSTQITLNTTSDEVWKLVGNYNGINTWHPAVKTSVLHGTGFEFGDVRVLTLNNGAKLYDELISYDASTMSYTYRAIKSPLPVYGYLSNFVVKDNGNNTSTVIWTVRFYADGVHDNEAIELLKGIYNTGLSSLADRFNK